MIWWLANPDRFLLERSELAKLAADSPWLSLHSHRLEKDMVIAVDFAITDRDEVFEMVLRYPGFFPDTPPTILPRDDRRISGHQYGAGGELCLEFRADNWSPDVTGAMMIESAHRLIAGERDDSADRRVASAHQYSVGRSLRGSHFRLIETEWLRSLVPTLIPGQVYSASITERDEGNAYLTNVRSVTTEIELFDHSASQSGSRLDAKLIRLESLSELQPVPELNDVVTLLEGKGMLDVAQSFATDPVSSIILTDGETTRLLRSFTYEDKRPVLRFQTVVVPTHTRRLPPSYDVLAEITVGVVGSGSLGSKVGASLARSGIGNFVLIDDDVLLPDNLCRNDLDWRSVGNHKAEALLARMKEINPLVKGRVFRMGLGTQEDAMSTASAMEALAKCQILIDATAVDSAFNFIASVARRQSIPMLWGKIFAGGIGGMVARARPGYDPPPLSARRQLQTWAEAQNIPWKSGNNYDAEAEDGTPLVADDAEVTIIAGHLTRLAIDTLVNGQATKFQHPAFFVGMSQGWIFVEAFDTWPVDYVEDGGWKDEAIASDEAIAEVREFVSNILDDKGADSGTEPVT